MSKLNAAPAKLRIKTRRALSVQSVRRSTALLSPAVSRGAARGGPLGASQSDRPDGWQPLRAISDMEPQVCCHQQMQIETCCPVPQAAPTMR